MKKTALGIFVAIFITGAADTTMCQTHQHGVNQRGDHAMGFDHKKTTHHFRLLSDGGVIEVAANDPQDEASRDKIRGHLAHIVKLFAEGDFSLPMFIHDQMPPGADRMKQLKSSISYKMEKTERGGRVRISTADREALAAIHEFLRFQIQDHKTGDSLDIGKP